MVSYETLMERKLDLIDDKRDKRQGSVIYDALAPNAAETAAFYADLDMLEDRTFADTAAGDDLTRRAAERGILRKGAVKATFYGSFLDEDGAEYPVEAGTRFFLEEYHYVVLFREDDGRYVLECETAGACGNDYLGNLIPLETMAGLAAATLEELRTNGEDEEGDETEDDSEEEVEGEPEDKSETLDLLKKYIDEKFEDLQAQISALAKQPKEVEKTTADRLSELERKYNN